MAYQSRIIWVIISVLPLLVGCPTIVPDPAPAQTGCAADDPRVGQTAVLQSYFHGIAGTARIVDNCTIVIDNFSYDGGGLDVRIVGHKNMDEIIGTPLTSTIKRDGGYTNETLTVPLPEGVTLDDVRIISVTCVSYNIVFGAGTFE